MLAHCQAAGSVLQQQTYTQATCRHRGAEAQQQAAMLGGAGCLSGREACAQAFCGVVYVLC